MAGRPTVLTPPVRRQLALLLDVGITQEIAARAVGVSTRTVQRFAARRREAAEPKTIEQLVEELPTLAEVLADHDRPRTVTRRSRRSTVPDWREAARALDASEGWDALTGEDDDWVAN